MKKINCYVHIPFCTSKCKYCRFASFWGLKELQINTYVDFLCNEIKNYSDKNLSLDTIYFGWWTPWVLTEKQFSKILQTFKDWYNFSENIEISIESTPENVTEKNISDWKKLWINRLSMWIQSLREDTLKEIWRAWKWDILTALENIKKVWFDNVSADFILWLPFVKKWWIIEDLEYLFDKYDFLKHISVYMLEEYYDIPEDLDSKFENITYPDNWSEKGINEEDYLSEYEKIYNYLNKKWFHRYEISNYSKPGFECKHNVWYWNHKESLAFWLWAFWFIDNKRFSNSENFLEYYNNKNILSEKLEKNDLYLENIMFRLRTDWLKEKDLINLDKNKINYFLENKFLFKEDNIIKLTNKWILVNDYILSEII